MGERIPTFENTRVLEMKICMIELSLPFILFSIFYQFYYGYNNKIMYLILRLDGYSIINRFHSNFVIRKTNISSFKYELKFILKKI